MKVPTRQRRYGLVFNVTPLIDIVFLLIIFFLAASHFVRDETLEEISLPFATHSEDETEEGVKRLVVTIKADRSLYVGSRAVSADQLEEMILKGAGDFGSNFEVRIRGDRTVPYHIVEPIMLSSARAGITKIKWAVIVK